MLKCVYHETFGQWLFSAMFGHDGAIVRHGVSQVHDPTAYMSRVYEVHANRFTKIEWGAKGEKNEDRLNETTHRIVYMHHHPNIPILLHRLHITPHTNLP